VHPKSLDVAIAIRRDVDAGLLKRKVAIPQTKVVRHSRDLQTGRNGLRWSDHAKVCVFCRVDERFREKRAAATAIVRFRGEANENRSSRFAPNARSQCPSMSETYQRSTR